MSAENLIPTLQPVEISQLSLQHLFHIKDQIDAEVGKLEKKFEELKLAISKYSGSKESLEQVSAKARGDDEVLINLTSIMYVHARLDDVRKVLVDIGAGYFAKMDIESAIRLFQRKIDFATDKSEQIGSVLEEKKGIRQVIIETIKKKIITQFALNDPEAGPSAIGYLH